MIAVLALTSPSVTVNICDCLFTCQHSVHCAGVLVVQSQSMMASTTVSLSGSPKKPTNNGVPLTTTVSLSSGRSPKKKNAFSQTVLEYGEACSLHGIQYIFEREQNLIVSRLFWLLVVLGGIALGLYWSVEVSTK